MFGLSLTARPDMVPAVARLEQDHRMIGHLDGSGAVLLDVMDPSDLDRRALFAGIA